MTIDRESPQSSVESAVRLAAELVRLPAIPTSDWCLQVAHLCAGALPDSIVSILICPMSGEGLLGPIESVGVASRVAAVDARSLARLRRAGARTIDWAIDPLTNGGCEVLIRAGQAHGFWNTPSGARWLGMGARDVMLIAAPILNGSSQRRLVIEIATLRQEGLSEADVSLAKAIAPLIASKASVAFGFEEKHSLQRLTDREREILQLLTCGWSVREIAEYLRRSHHTIHDHVKSLHRKLRANTRAELVARALGHDSESVAPAGARPSDGGEGAIAPVTSIAAVV